MKFQAKVVILVTVFFVFIGHSAHAATTPPELPRVYIDTTMPVQTGAIFNVANSCAGLSNCSTNLQTAINNAQPGDTIILKAGDIFPGTFSLPNKTNPSNKWIIIESSKLSSLPAPGKRVSLADAVNMPTITGGNSQPQTAIQTQYQANHYRFVGIRFIPNPAIFSTGLIRIGDTNVPETTVGQLPHDITFDRVIISGDPVLGGRRGIALNGRMTAVIDSYLNDWKEAGSDSAAMGGWNGAEGYKIVNNYLEGAGENVFFGGSPNSIPGVNPSDIEVRDNYFYKPASWMTDSTPWIIKCLFELKVGERVLVEGNVMDGSWAGQQGGKAFNFKSTNQYGTGPSYYHTGDVTVRYNYVRNVGSVMSLIGIYPPPATVMNNFSFTNNVVEKINVAPYFSDPGGPSLFTTGGSPAMPNVQISHNTMVSTGNILAAMEPDGVIDAVGFDFDNNIIMGGIYGFKAAGTQSGDVSLVKSFTNYSFKNNAIVGGASTGPVGTNTYYPATLSALNFTDLANSNYLIASGNLKNGGSDGKDVGADIPTLNSMITGVVAGTPGTFTPAPPSDTTSPTVPTGLIKGTVTTTSIVLNWNTSTDNTAVTGYKIYRNGTQIAIATGTTYLDQGLTAATTYSYTVSAYDAAGNNSSQSAGLSIATLSNPVNNPPTGTLVYATPLSISFGSVNVGSASTSVIISLYNPTTANITVNPTTTGDFAISQNYCNLGAVSNTHCDVYATFTPTQSGARTGTLTFTEPGVTGSPQIVILSGVGLGTSVTPPVIPPVIPPTAPGVLLPAGTFPGDVIFMGVAPMYLVESDGLHPFDTTASLNLYLQTGKLIKPTPGNPANYTISTITAAQYLNQPGMTPTSPASPTSPTTPVTPPVTLPTGSAHPAGSNTTYQGTIFFYDGTNRHAYTSAGAFLSYGFNSFANALPSTSADTAIPLSTFAAPMDGSLINDHGTVYLITNGKRAGFVSEQVFFGLGYSYANVLAGDTSFMTTLTPISNAATTHPAGTLVIYQGTVYIVGNTGKIGIPDMNTFYSWGYNLKNVVNANQYDISASLPQTNILPARPASALNALGYIGG
ncbi:MAG: hypothetical protein JWO40_120 [Candidatus Doudnabacteria bacterium]|nr:hypothetical protein [Candidatus Doudnabacteria bacterium]